MRVRFVPGVADPAAPTVAEVRAGIEVQHFTAGTLGTLDMAPHDPTPDRCWRCDARPGTDDVGLCDPCGVSLRRTDG